LEDGLNTSTSIGANFNVDYSSNLKLNSHYIYNSISNDLNKTTTSDNLNVDDQFTTLESIVQDKRLYSHGINTKLSYKVNPLFELIFKNNLEIKDDIQNSNTQSLFAQNEQNLGQTSSINQLENSYFNIDSHTSIRNRFRKKGRSIISTILYKHGDSRADDIVNSNNNLFGNTMQINQIQDYQSTLQQFSLTSHYTEPITPTLYLGVEYNYASSIENPLRNYFNIINTEAILDTDLSSDFRKVYLYHTAGVSLRKNSKRLKTKFGLKRQWITLDGISNMGLRTINGTYRHWLPSLSLDLKMKGNKSLSLSYNTSVHAPRLEQLLPLQVNANPNFNYIGNPNLIPEYSHRVDAQFNLFDNFNLSSLFSNFSYSLSKNRIVNKTDVNSELFRTITPINSDDYKSFRAFFRFNRPFRPLHISYTVQTQFGHSAYSSILNGLNSPVTDTNVEITWSLQNRNTDHVFVEAGVRYNRTRTSYEINTDFNQSFSDLDFFIDSDVYLPAGLTISTELHYNRYSSGGFIDPPQFYLWTASISKLLLNDKIEVKLSAHDILNQNIGYRRFGAATSISEERFDTLSQYFMASFFYKIGRGKKNNNISIEIAE